MKLPHLVEKPLKEGQCAGEVAQLDWRTIESDCNKPFIASELEFIPLPVNIYPSDDSFNSLRIILLPNNYGILAGNAW